MPLHAAQANGATGTPAEDAAEETAARILVALLGHAVRVPPEVVQAMITARKIVSAAMILRQPGRGGGEFGEGGDIVHEDEVEGRRPK